MWNRMWMTVVAATLVAATLVAAPGGADPIPVGNEFQVHVATTGDQDFPDLAMDGAGNFVVVWQSELAGTDTSSIRGRRFDSDARPLAGEIQISDYATGVDTLPRLAMTDQGDFVVVWTSQSGDGSEESIRGRRFDADGGPLGDSFQVNTFTTGRQLRPALAADADGDFVVAWQSDGPDGSTWGVRGRRFGSDGTAFGSEFQVNGYTTGRQAGPRVASDPGGDFVVVWTDWDDLDGSFLSVQGRRFDSLGTARGDDFQVNTYTTNFQSFPDVAVEANGDFVVVWSDRGMLFDNRLAGRRYAADGTTLGDQFQLNVTIEGSLFLADVALDSGGNSVVSWSRRDPDVVPSGPPDIFVRRFTRDGDPRGGELRVNDYLTGSQSSSSVAVAPDGGFVITWHSDDSDLRQDGSGNAVMGRLFSVDSGLSVNSSDDRDPVLVDEPLTYTLEVANGGPPLATGILVVDTLPAGVELLSVGGDGWDCDEDSGIVTCSRPDLGLTSAPPIAIEVSVPSTAGLLSNSVTVSSDVVDLGEDTAVETTEVLLTSDIFADGLESGDVAMWSSSTP